jgi:hypothetical protein
MGQIAERKECTRRAEGVSSRAAGPEHGSGSSSPAMRQLASFALARQVGPDVILHSCPEAEGRDRLLAGSDVPSRKEAFQILEAMSYGNTGSGNALRDTDWTLW